MAEKILGHAVTYGDNINTDVIIPARYCTRFDMEYLSQHCMEDLDPGFLRKRKPGDILVVGSNFGCGSSRESAPLAIKGAGISCIIAESFARIFYRNAINIGLPIFECKEIVEVTQNGDLIEVDSERGLLSNLTRSKSFHSVPYPGIIQEIIVSGGMMNFVKQRLRQKS
jgi:3-isopropylmalate/(R)-2-methylmalate dehydratase small subunit